MNEPTLHGLTERLDRLERANRRWKRAAATLAIGVAAVLLMGQVAPRRVVEAEKFVLRDLNGKERATLFTAFDGSVSLALTGKDRELRAVLTVGKDGSPALGLYDKDGKARAGLTVEANGAPGLSLYGKGEDLRVTLKVLANGVPQMALYHGEARPRMLFALGADGSPRLALTGMDGKPRVGLGTAGETYALLFYDSKEKVRIGMSAEADGTAQLRFFDKNENVMWSAP